MLDEVWDDDAMAVGNQTLALEGDGTDASQMGAVSTVSKTCTDGLPTTPQICHPRKEARPQRSGPTCFRESRLCNPYQVPKQVPPLSSLREPSGQMVLSQTTPVSLVSLLNVALPM